MCYFLPFFGELEIRFRHGGTYLMVTQKTLSTFKEKEMVFSRKQFRFNCCRSKQMPETDQITDITPHTYTWITVEFEYHGFS